MVYRCRPTRVFTVPVPVRYQLAFDADLTRAVLRVFLRTVFGWLRQRAVGRGIIGGRGAAVTAIQRFGGARNAFTSPCRHPGRSGPRLAARVRNWPTWIGRLRWSAADRPAPLPRGAYLDETPGPGLLLAVQGYERDIQMMRSRDVHSVDATEPKLGGQLCGGAPQSAVEVHEAQFSGRRSI